MATLTPDQTTVLQAAMQRVMGLKNDLALAESHVEAVIIGITGESGNYNLVTESNPWRLEKTDEVDTLAELNRLVESGEGIDTESDVLFIPNESDDSAGV